MWEIGYVNPLHACTNGTWVGGLAMDEPYACMRLYVFMVRRLRARRRDTRVGVGDVVDVEDMAKEALCGGDVDVASETRIGAVAGSPWGAPGGKKVL